MADDIRIVLDMGAVASLVDEPEVRALLMEIGRTAASAAASAAPHLTGAGAASIHPELVDHEVDVGWDAEHHYMFFHEFGDRYMPARPFLAPALDYAHI